VKSVIEDNAELIKEPLNIEFQTKENQKQKKQINKMIK
jgi:hypothetical protein